MGLRILGIDPGSRRTGYGIIESEGTRNRWVAHGTVNAGDGDLPERLKTIFNELSEIVTRFQPAETAVEEVFVKLNISSALVLGQARGAAICALAQTGLPVFEYTPARIKQTVAGHGRAEKQQIQQMIKILLKLPDAPATDAADALAVAVCHAHLRGHELRLKAALQKSAR